MQALRSQTALRRGGIVYLRTDELTPNPVQPRKRFDDELTEYLLKLKWWDWDAEKIFANLDALTSGDVEKIREIG